MTPAEFREYRLMWGISQEKLARYMGTTVTTVWRWENGKSRINQGWAHNTFYGLTLLKELQV